MYYSCIYFLFFFFFKQKTAYEMRISDWSSDVCSSDLYVGDHKPPHFNDVDDWMDRFVSTVQENWYVWTPTELAAFGLWRLNWIHPFIEGNGRTARAACYFLLCVRRSEEHTSELQSLMRISYAVFCLKKKNHRPTSATHKQSQA